MKNKFNTATFLRQLTLTLLVAMLAAAFQTARAQESQVEYPEYITDVMLIGGSEATINTLKTQYETTGWTIVNYDLNYGCSATEADRIYLLYKKGNRKSTDGGYITDLKVSKFDWVESLNVTIDNNTYTYKYCPFDGDESFKSNNGDLNSNKVGNALHLYYTKQNFPDKRALASIWVNADNGIPESAPDGIAYNQYLTVCYTSNTAEVNLNSGVNGGGNIVMHYATNTKTNRPSSDPKAVENLTYNGNPQELITFSDDNTNSGTMMYRVGTSGDFSSDIPTAIEVDNYTVYYYAASNDYGDQSETKSLEVSIGKANNSVTTTALDLTYTGSAQNLINPYTATFGDVLYSLDNTTFSSDIPQATDAKDYTIYYKVEGTSNYNGVSGTATATIKKAANNNATVSIANSIDGKANVNPTVTDNLSTGTITYQYSTSPNGDFSTAKPNAPGTWYVIATIAADDNCEAYTTAPKNFTLIDWEGDGTSNSPYLIKSTTDLDLLATKVNNGNAYAGTYFKLGADITYSYAGLGETESNFTAIGTSANPFSGTFDGGNNNGYSISGIRINASTKYQGLFGYVRNNATIQNVTLENTEIKCSSFSVGGIAGRNSGSILNCTSSATVSSGNSCYDYGGIAGRNDGEITNCTSSATVSASGDFCNYHGGIAGTNYGTISSCTSSATVSASGNSCNYYGGIAGFNGNGGTLTNNLAIDAVISSSSEYGAIAGHNAGTLQYNFYYNCTVKGVNNATGVGCNGKDYYRGAVSPDLIIDGDSETPVAITERNAEENVLYLRKLKAGVTSTIILPFAFDASSMPGTFYRLTSVNTDDWTAGANKVTGTLSANTPYLFLPNTDIEQTVFTIVTLEPTTNDNSTKIDDNWTFHGVYEKILWETAPKNHYGFSGINKGSIAAGDFVMVGENVRIKPTRAYLTYDDGISKSAIVLPDRIHVIFSDEEITSVIDPIDTPTDDPTEDITTPVSELPAQASNVKVWSYEKTIYIQAAPDTDYRIIDAAGRVLRSATTQTDRDEIRLGNLSGIVIVIINNKTYKINY